MCRLLSREVQRLVQSIGNVIPRVVLKNALAATVGGRIMRANGFAKIAKKHDMVGSITRGKKH